MKVGPLHKPTTRAQLQAPHFSGELLTEQKYVKTPYVESRANLIRWKNVRTVLEKQRGLRPIKFLVMSMPEWLKRLELGKVITLELKAHRGWQVRQYESAVRESIGVDVEQAFGDFTVAVDRAVREAVAMRMV